MAIILADPNFLFPVGTHAAIGSKMRFVHYDLYLHGNLLP